MSACFVYRPFFLLFKHTRKVWKTLVEKVTKKVRTLINSSSSQDRDNKTPDSGNHNYYGLIKTRKWSCLSTQRLIFAIYEYCIYICIRPEKLDFAGGGHSNPSRTLTSFFCVQIPDVYSLLQILCL